REDVAAAAELSHHRGRKRSDEDGDRASRVEDLRVIYTMIKVRQISHATFETPNLEAQIEHYTKVTGLVVATREQDRALLTSKVGQLVLQLKRGERARCAKLAFHVTPNSDFGEMSRFLTAQGIKNEERNDDIPGMPKLLAFEDIKGTTIELLSEWRHLTPSQSTAGVSPFKLGHVAF